MADLTIDSTQVREVEVIEQLTGPAEEALALGDYARLNTSTGKLEKGNGTTAAEARAGGVVIQAAETADLTATILRKGIVFLGDALDSLTFDDDVFLSNTDGTLADTAGTVSLIVGTVVPLYGYATYNKGLRVDL